MKYRVRAKVARLSPHPYSSTFSLLCYCKNCEESGSFVFMCVIELAHSPRRPKTSNWLKICRTCFVDGAAFIALVVFCRVDPVSVDATRQL